jgi:hypothetical protein
MFECGFCSHRVGAHLGFHHVNGTPHGVIYLCPNCDKPTFIDAKGIAHPGVRFGRDVEHVPVEVLALYDEARDCYSISAYTAAVLLCRKLLMNIGVTQGAAANLAFIAYVEYLAANGFVPPNGKGWVDHIRRKGNEATHEIVVMTADDAKDLINFSEMLLKFIYEFPKKIPAAP